MILILPLLFLIIIRLQLTPLNINVQYVVRHKQKRDLRRHVKLLHSNLTRPTKTIILKSLLAQVVNVIDKKDKKKKTNNKVTKVFDCVKKSKSMHF